MSKLKDTALRTLSAVSAVALLLVSAACGTSSEIVSGGAVVDKELYISEFMASNSYVLADADGDYSDWIEIHNATDKDVNIEGCTLTDDEKKPSKWTFPPRSYPRAAI